MSSTRRREKILFVDDDPRVAAEVEKDLRGEFQLHVADTAEEALLLCRENGPFAVIVSDHELAGGCGREFLTRVCNGWPDSVRVLVTEDAKFDLAARAIEQGGTFVGNVVDV